MKMTSKLTAASGIAKTDASYHSGDTVTLYEMNFDEILANPESLKEMKDSYPIETAEYAVANQLQSEPAFLWWAPYTLRKRDRIISAA